MRIRTFIVDAFTNEAFKGNPAGVCFLERDIDDSIMQSIATELNFSETAFLRKTPKKNTFNIRYFSPKMEIPFCGHATLASSKVIFSRYRLKTIKIVTKHGLHVEAENKRDGISMLFPVYDTLPFAASKKMLDALGLKSVESSLFAKEPRMAMLEISDPTDLINLSPDFNALINSENSISGVIVTAKSNVPDFDFYSRYFWPWSGTNEDPVTGAAHSVLSKFWSQKLQKNELSAYQVSKRGGYMKLKVVGEKLEVKSNAVIIFEGSLHPRI